VLPAEKVKSRIAALAVGLAADCDRPESDVQKIMSENLKGAGTLPFVGFLTPDLKWVGGYSGGKNEAGFIALLDEVEKSPLLDATDAVKKKLLALADKAAKAVEKSDWKAVITAGHEAAATTGRSPDRVRLDDLVKKAHDWAGAELDRIVDEVRRGGDLPAARKSLGDVKRQMAGEPEAADVETGLKALSKLATIRSVEADPKGVDPAAMREKGAKEFESSRWKAVFEAAPAK
jgi:hypothetical protein